ncbi:cadherin-like protein 26 [Erpetoichthys calabaricus]|uniref:cadherin-like protein 26 n=1 Tax=Erpetoichthys calabaricus TaxID=27687 RepID=UPI002234B7B7|nr:cadherin-like protein 26 [Erpetoichthys calabaricus]
MKSLVLLTLLIYVESSLQSLSRLRRTWIIDSITIEEESQGPFPYTVGSIKLDRKYAVEFSLKGQGVDQDPVGVVAIDEYDGTIKVKRKIDREQYPRLDLTFEARNTSNNKVDTRLGVEIKILDINDNAPEFLQKVYKVSLKESDKQGKQVTMVQAVDIDEGKNREFHYSLISQSPDNNNAQFFIDPNTGIISFRGCLDYEVAEQYTIIVEAKDHGEKVQLSSSATVIIDITDENNNKPIEILRIPNNKVKVNERETNVEILRIKVDDKDTPFTSAWRAQYIIERGNENKNFNFTTDPKTNDGVLMVIKPLDYETAKNINFNYKVENEAPYFWCKVKERTPNSLWQLDNYIEPRSGGNNLLIEVQDVNDPPNFVPPINKIHLEENAPVGTLLNTFTARDEDDRLINDFVYSVAKDDANWISINPKTGEIKTIKVLDRESPFVINNTYTAILYAIDNGKPPATGTGTLVINLKDVNDCVPHLNHTHITMCRGNTASMANISIIDEDQEPYSGPFTFTLLNKDQLKNSWRLDSTYGNTVHLIKESRVELGTYVLEMEIADQQGETVKQNLTVIVCDCTGNIPVCTRSMHTGIGFSAIFVILGAALFLLAALLALLVCKFHSPEVQQISGENNCYIINYNQEEKGTDPMLDKLLPVVNEKNGKSNENHIITYKESKQQAQLHSSNNPRNYQVNQNMYANQFNGFLLNATKTVKNPSRTSTYQYNYDVNTLWATNRIFLEKKAHNNDDNSCYEEYQPHQYTEEYESAVGDLDAISIKDPDLTPDDLDELGPKFMTLASILTSTQKKA